MRLNDIPKKDPLRSPSDPLYFDQLPDKVMQRIREEKTEGKQIRMNTFRWVAAAALVLLLSLPWVWEQPDRIPETHLSSIPEETLRAYLLVESELSTNDLLYYAEEENLQLETELPPDLGEEALEEEILEWEDLEEYL